MNGGATAPKPLSLEALLAFGRAAKEKLRGVQTARLHRFSLHYRHGCKNTWTNMNPIFSSSLTSKANSSIYASSFMITQEVVFRITRRLH